jgi:hypothetical protein
VRQIYVTSCDLVAEMIVCSVGLRKEKNSTQLMLTPERKHLTNDRMMIFPIHIILKGRFFEYLFCFFFMILFV